MDEDLARLERRVKVLETLLAFQFAAQHMQTSDPAAAIRGLRSLLVSPDATLPAGAADDPELAAEFERVVGLVESLQHTLPRRLVD
jgi:hypothetical protein